MNKIYLVIMSLFIFGCSDNRELTKIEYKFDNFCEKDTIKERSSFILKCIENANPNSDEEPEDWIRQCQIMAEETFCEKIKIKITKVKLLNHRHYNIVNKEKL